MKTVFWMNILTICEIHAFVLRFINTIFTEERSLLTPIFQITNNTLYITLFTNMFAGKRTYGDPALISHCVVKT